MSAVHAVDAPYPTTPSLNDWRRQLPVLTDGSIVLRSLRLDDAPALLDHFNDPVVLRFVTRCPSTVEGFRHFVRWTTRERRHGRHACFGIVPPAIRRPVGILQVWPVEKNFVTAEWGFVVGRSYWGTGLFDRSARLLLDAIFFDNLFGPPGVHRLECRAVDANGRGNAALRKLGAVREGVLRGGFHDEDSVRDHVMWSILAPDWRSSAMRDGHREPVRMR